VFSLNLPQALFDKVKGSRPEYGDHFRRTLREESFSGLTRALELVVSDAMWKPAPEKHYGDKKLFVYLKTQAKQTRSELFGGRTELLTTIEFGFFPGWVLIEQPEPHRWGDELIPRAPIRQIFTAKTQGPATTPQGYAVANSDFRGYQIPDADNLVEMCAEGQGGFGFKQVMSRYRVIDHTPEREAFLQNIETRLGGITQNLSGFFGSLDEGGIDQLMLSNPQFLLSE
jgi:hypothetical protein